MQSIIQLFQQISSKSNSVKGIFDTLSITEYPNHRISKSEIGQPILLINVLPSHRNLNLPNIKLQNITVHFDTRCKVSIKEESTEGVFTIISLLGLNNELQDYFLNLCSLLLQAIGNTPNQTQTYTEVCKLIELFKAANQPPLKSIQGLWAELLFIEQAKDTQTFIKSWHSSPTDRYDFSYKTERLEIKSTSVRKREHHFSLDQLTPPPNVQLLIGSVFVEKMSNGRTLEDLKNSIIQKLQNNFELKDSLNLIIAKTLGSSIIDSMSIGFDYELAVESINFYDIVKIPSINPKHIPNEISSIHFKVNLTDIEDTKDVEHLDLISKF